MRAGTSRVAAVDGAGRWASLADEGVGAVQGGGGAKGTHLLAAAGHAVAEELQLARRQPPHLHRVARPAEHLADHLRTSNHTRGRLKGLGVTYTFDAWSLIG
jgi:hypothetical protein